MELILVRKKIINDMFIHKSMVAKTFQIGLQLEKTAVS